MATFAEHGGTSSTLRLVSQNGAAIELPGAVQQLLLQIVRELGEGNAVTVVPVHAELTTQEAADLLNVSRPYLIGLVDDHRLPCSRTAGRHRRLRLADVDACVLYPIGLRDTLLDVAEAGFYRLLWTEDPRRDEPDPRPSCPHTPTTDQRRSTAPTPGRSSPHIRDDDHSDPSTPKDQQAATQRLHVATRRKFDSSYRFMMLTTVATIVMTDKAASGGRARPSIVRCPGSTQPTWQSWPVQPRRSHDDRKLRSWRPGRHGAPKSLRSDHGEPTSGLRPSRSRRATPWSLTNSRHARNRQRPSRGCLSAVSGLVRR